MIIIYGIVAIVVLFGIVAFRGAPYVPSHPRQVRKAFTELYPLTSADVVVDAGSGDGLVLRAAVRCGARAVGYELNPLLVVMSRLWSWGQRRIEVHTADFWRVTPPSDMTLLYAFSVSRDVAKLERYVQAIANRQQRSFHVMMYGASLPTLPVKATMGAHTLHIVTPRSKASMDRALQTEKP